MLPLETLIQQLINGLSLGSVYALSQLVIRSYIQFSYFPILPMADFWSSADISVISRFAPEG